jgi:hypothetical protein
VRLAERVEGAGDLFDRLDRVIGQVIAVLLLESPGSEDRHSEARVRREVRDLMANRKQVECAGGERRSGNGEKRAGADQRRGKRERLLHDILLGERG